MEQSWKKSCHIEDRDIKTPLLIDRWEDEPVPDIREAAKKNREEGVIGDTGAEVFFCDTMKCVKQKDEVLTLCGMENHNDILEEHINKLCTEYRDAHGSIRVERERIAKQEKLLEALAVKLGYEHISFSESGVQMVKHGISSHYPQKRRRAG